MNATNRPGDFLLNIESPKINLTQRHDNGNSSSRNSELSALNRKENSFDDVYRQQRREDNEVRYSAQQKRSSEHVSNNENRSQQVQQSASVKQSRAETQTTTDGKALPHQVNASREQGGTAVVTREAVVVDVDASGGQPSTLELTQDVDVTVNFDVSEFRVGEGEVSVGSVDSAETEDTEPRVNDLNVAEQVAVELDTGFSVNGRGEVNITNETTTEGVTPGDVKLAQNAEQQATEAEPPAGKPEQPSNAEQTDQHAEETVILQSQQRQSGQQQATSPAANVDVGARAAQVAGVAVNVARESNQNRLGETLENATKGEVNLTPQTKVAGTGAGAGAGAGAGTELAGQQAPPDRLAQLSNGVDFKILREQLAANTVKVDAGTVGGAKVASADSADSADAQPRLNALTQASQALAPAKPGVVSASVQTPVNSSEWGQAMSQRIMWLANRGISSAELQLNPRDLGPVDVRINVTGEQTSVQFSSPNAAVREALESSVVRLREMMESSGLDLADVNVSDQSQSEHAEADAGNASAGSESAEKDELEGVAESGVTQVIETDGLVDFYA